MHSIEGVMLEAVVTFLLNMVLSILTFSALLKSSELLEWFFLDNFLGLLLSSFLWNFLFLPLYYISYPPFNS